ncbi:MAG: hypothetical protein SGJ10_02430 [Bacteroidota bacterium]|nr:hypothetical protein [Bacteroidota bacterium]
MKKIILSIIITLPFIQTTLGQTITLSKLIEMATCKTLSSFDTLVRAEGFTFKAATEKKDKSIQDLYIKQTNSNTLLFKIFLVYVDWHDQKPTISFKASSNALPNLITQIKSELETFGFLETFGSPKSEGATITHTYKNTKYEVLISDKTINENGSTYNEFHIYLISL